MGKKPIALCAILLCSSFLFNVGWTFCNAKESTEDETYLGNEYVVEDPITTPIILYRDYQANRKSAPVDTSIPVDIQQFVLDKNMDATIENINGSRAVVTGDYGRITWTFTVEHNGLYDLGIDYIIPKGKGNAVERILYIDGQIPYREARNIQFNRIWENEEKNKIYTTSGNEYRRTQIEQEGWQRTLLHSALGYSDSSLKIYLETGDHTLTLESVSGVLAIGGLELAVISDLRKYTELQREYEDKGYAKATQSRKIQAEDAVRKSHPTLYAVEDRTSPANEPSDESLVLLNCIGSNAWKYRHQWIEWDFIVPEDGLYTLSLRTKQDFVSGAGANRRLYINGEVPFEEASYFTIPYDLGWQIVTLGQGKEPWQFYLTAGKTHTLRLEVVVGPLDEILQEINEIVQELNTLYRKIKMVVGNFPDPLRDYNLNSNIPNLYEIISTCHNRLKIARDSMVSILGTAGEHTVFIDRLMVQLDSFINYPDSIPKRIKNLNDNINNISSWVVSASEVPLLIDYLLFAPLGKDLPAADVPWYIKLWSSIKSFFISFINDYFSIESVDEQMEIVEQINLWLGVGRDQSMIIKNLADRQFTSKTGVGLNIRLVDMSILLQAVSSGKGPDVAIFMDHAQPVNYGLRGALYDLSLFKDIDEILNRFNKSAIIPFKIGDALYALPEQQIFPMIFYRTDIFEELEIRVPDTWDDIQRLIPILHEQNMEIGLPPPSPNNTGSHATNLNMTYAALLLQNGSAVYDQDNRYCVLDDLTAVNSFIKWTEYYTKYNFPRFYSDINRFRTGEMPLLLAPYTFYNTLSLAAPEIKGLWTMAPIPGTKQADGIINRTTSSTVTGSVIFQNAKNYKACWEFLKWWTSTEAQVSYGREIEALQGTSARWPTANLEAMQELDWNTDVARQITQQWEHVIGIPEVAGGYYVGRSIDNAIKSVINSGEDARETILDQVDKVNREIRNKRRELGLE